jgi:hypothetical protein
MPIDITDVTRRVQYAGSGTGPYNFTFQILDDDDIAVYRDDTLLVKTTDYSVTINGDGTGSITTVASQTGFTVTILGARPYARLTDFSTGGDFFADDVNDELDGILILIQQIRESTNRAVSISSTSTYPGSKTFPDPGAGEYLRWNVAGNALETVSAAPDAGTFTQSGTGAVARSWTAKVGETVSVKDFGAAGDGVTDDTVAIQTALNTGLDIDFVGGTYLCAGLTQSTNQQALYSSTGMARFVKSANGVILTCSGNDLLFQNLKFDGESGTYTGNNWNISGDRPTILNCGSRDAAGRALLATGGRVVIKGSGDIWQTTDATATGYDIEIGVSGTLTLYHHIEDVYSSQSTGGILLTDVGSHTIIGGLFGKLNIAAGTSPAGVNGGKTIGARIVGDTSVGLSSSVFTGNQFSNVNITFEAGTSQHSFDASNSVGASAVITNNGNANSVIIRSISVGSTITQRYGADSSFATLRATPASPGQFLFSNLGVANNTGVRFRNAADDGEDGAISFSAAGDMSINNAGTNRTTNFSTTGTASGSRFGFIVGGTTRMVVDDNGIRAGGTSAPYIRSGAGTPEGAVTGIVGSVYLRNDGGAGTTLYIKESGTGNTGWVAK